MQERLSNWSLARQGPSCTTLLFDCSADTTLPRLGGVLRCSPLSNPHNSEWKGSSGQSWSSAAWRWNFVATPCGTHQFLGTPTRPDYHHVFNLCSRWDFYIIEIWLLFNSTATGGCWFPLAPPAPTLVHRHLLFSTARTPRCSSRRARRDFSHPCSLPQCSPPCRPLSCHPPHQGAQHQHNLRAGRCSAGLLLRRLLLHHRSIFKNIFWVFDILTLRWFLLGEGSTPPFFSPSIGRFFCSRFCLR